MSANLVVDLRNTTDYRVSTFQGSGANLIVGEVVDLLHANTYTNVFVVGGAGSGSVEVRIQTADATTSGSFTDPTSGLVLGQFPVGIVSGGILVANSGIWSSGNYSVSSPASGVLFQSGGVIFGAFQRPHRYARLIQVSSVFPAPVFAGFIAQKRTTGSGAGFSFSPGSGTVNV
jgi:hypothetical protein